MLYIALTFHLKMKVLFLRGFIFKIINRTRFAIGVVVKHGSRPVLQLATTFKKGLSPRWNYHLVVMCKFGFNRDPLTGWMHDLLWIVSVCRVIDLTISDLLMLRWCGLGLRSIVVWSWAFLILNVDINIVCFCGMMIDVHWILLW